MRNILILLLLVTGSSLLAHPNGNIIVTQNNCVLWPYVNPVGDIGHHASVMLWDQHSLPRTFLVSEYESSDFFLYAKDEAVYIMESRYSGADHFETRILKTSINFEPPQVIWSWFTDRMHLGVGGYQMVSDEELIFVHYPAIYSFRKDHEPLPLFSFSNPLKGMRPLDNGKLLLLGDNSIWMTDYEGKVIQEWNNLIENISDEAPLGRNQIYDADYSNGSLLIAYWGKRSFEIIDTNGNRENILALEKPWVSHWVAIWGEKELLFASYLDFDNGFTEDGLRTTIIPKLLVRNGNKVKEIWTSGF